MKGTPASDRSEVASPTGPITIETAFARTPCALVNFAPTITGKVLAIDKQVERRALVCLRAETRSKPSDPARTHAVSLAAIGSTELADGRCHRHSVMDDPSSARRRRMSRPATPALSYRGQVAERRIVKVMWDYDAFPLWVTAGRLGQVSSQIVPVSADLSRRLQVRSDGLTTLMWGPNGPDARGWNGPDPHDLATANEKGGSWRTSYEESWTTSGT